MNRKVFRIFVEKKPPFAVEAKKILEDLKNNLSVSALTGLRLFNRYDVEGIGADTFLAARNTIFSEPQVDDAYDGLPPLAGRSGSLPSSPCPASTTSGPTPAASASRF
jgi:phosphoribosylformylglycinamidine synthase